MSKEIGVVGGICTACKVPLDDHIFKRDGRPLPAPICPKVAA